MMEQVTNVKMYMTNDTGIEERLEGTHFSTHRDSMTTGPLIATAHFLEGE